MNTAKKTGSGFAAALIFAVARAVTSYHPATAATAVSIHDELQHYVDTRNPTLPERSGKDRTLVHVSLDGMVMTYSYEVDGEFDSAAVKAIQNTYDADLDAMRKSLCDTAPTRQALENGITYHYEYRTHGRLLVDYNISTCPTQQQAAATAPAEHLVYSFSRIGDRAIIHATGNIGLDEADAFNAWTASLPNTSQAAIRVGMTTLALDSPGGNVDGALHMMNWVKDNQIDTVVANGAQCASACVMIWGAGWHKAAGTESQIGVHSAQAYASNDPGKDAIEAVGTLAVARALADEKAPAAVIAAVTTTLSNDMHWLTADDAAAWGATILDKNGQPES